MGFFILQNLKSDVYPPWREPSPRFPFISKWLELLNPNFFLILIPQIPKHAWMVLNKKQMIAEHLPVRWGQLPCFLSSALWSTCWSPPKAILELWKSADLVNREERCSRRGRPNRCCNWLGGSAELRYTDCDNWVRRLKCPFLRKLLFTPLNSSGGSPFLFFTI